MYGWRRPSSVLHRRCMPRSRRWPAIMTTSTGALRSGKWRAAGGCIHAMSSPAPSSVSYPMTGPVSSVKQRWKLWRSWPTSSPSAVRVFRPSGASASTPSYAIWYCAACLTNVGRTRKAARYYMRRRRYSWNTWGYKISANCPILHRYYPVSTSSGIVCRQNTRPGRPRPRTVAVSELVRLQKFLSAAGVASRRRSEELIAEGRVEVDDRIVSRLGTRIDPTVARVRVDGVRVIAPEEHTYVIANKPRGMVCTMHDDRGREDLRALVSGYHQRLFHVGRLDTDTAGLLVLTDDGDLAHRMAHPSFEIVKT